MTQTLHATPEGLAQAAFLLGQGGLVAFATETVYGLGADAADDRAVAKIYEAKGRPSFNPLIAHVSDADMAKTYVVWSDQAEALAQAFWPGPLTLVLPSRPDAPVSKLVTAGLDTLAVRVPAQETARSLLSQVGRAIAAPSANRSGQISPTLTSHVLDGLEGRIDAVLDDGACSVGLESTILGLTHAPTLLRPGAVSADEIAQVLETSVARRSESEGISAPGQLLSHYAPKASVRLQAQNWRDGEARLGFGAVACDLNLSPAGDLVEAAANLFAHLHELDSTGAACIAVSPIPDIGLGIAINDRLARAAADR